MDLYSRYSKVTSKSYELFIDFFESMWDFVFFYRFYISRKYIGDVINMLKFDVWEESNTKRKKIRKLTPLMERIFSPLNIIYIDIDKGLIKDARLMMRRNDKLIIGADISEMPFKSGTFDVVIDFSTTNHLADRDFLMSLRETRRILKTNGLYLLYHLNKNYFNIDVWNRFYSKNLIPSYPRTIYYVKTSLEKMDLK